MAYIKTNSYEIDGEEIKVRFNCSSSGIFSANLDPLLMDKLGLKGKVIKNSLKDIEETISNAIDAYKEENTSYKLKIAINFVASGEFTWTPDGRYNPKFDPCNGAYKINVPVIRTGSILGFDYEKVIEENRDGRLLYYKAIPANRLPDDVVSDRIQVDGHILGRVEYLDHRADLIDYSDVAYENLVSITKQLQRASSFLIDIISSENTQLILGTKITKAIGQ